MLIWDRTKLYKKTVSAGPLVKQVVYSRTTPRLDPVTRAHRSAATKAAQHYLNCRNQLERLAFLIAANFGNDSVFVTLTFDNENLPFSKEEARIKVCKCLRRVREARRKRGGTLQYIYTVEGTADKGATDPRSNEYELKPWKQKEWGNEPSFDAFGKNDNELRADKKETTRFHAHIITKLSKSEWDELRALWPFGHVYISPLRAHEAKTFPRLAAYMTKDTRAGRTKNGERCYTCSKGLEKPSIKGEWVNTDDIEAPAEAIIFEDDYTGTSRWSYCHRLAYYNEPQTEQNKEAPTNKNKLRKRNN